MAKVIAIILVMFVINAFLIYVVIKTWERTNDKVNKFFLDRSSSFYADKTEELPKKVVNEPNKVVVKEKEVYVYDGKIDSSSYKDSDFSNKYKNVKEHLDIDKKSIINEVINTDYNYDISIENVAIDINSTITFDTIYQLSTLPSDEQIQILRSSFDLSQETLLNQYLKDFPSEFNAIEFFSYINNIAKENDPNYYVKTGLKKENFNNLNENVKTLYDENITEGIKIVHKDKLYDYSI